MSEAESRVVAKGTTAAAKLLSSLNAQGRSGASMPVVLDSFFSEIGGEEAYGKMLAYEFQRSRGENLDPEEQASFSFSGKIVQNWFELISRYVDRTDANKSLDVSSLGEAELESILADLGRKQIEEDPSLRRTILFMAIRDDAKFRRMAFEEAIKEDPSLVDRLLRENGIKTVAGQARQLDPEDEYDPSDEEYKDD